MTYAPLTSLGWTESEALNRLQEAGLISDLCMTIADIAEADGERVLEWLKDLPKS